jgi:hypothetical protein
MEREAKSVRVGVCECMRKREGIHHQFGHVCVREEREKV